MDSLALQAMVRELQPAMVGQTINRVKLCSEPPPTLCLNLRSSGDLVVALFPLSPLCFLSRNDLALDSNASDQSALLRKHLNGARFMGIRKEFGDRVVFFELENHRSVPSRQRVTLVIELIPNRSNVLVLDRAQHVVFSLRRRKPAMVSDPHQYEPPSRRFGVPYERISREEFEQLVSLHHDCGIPGTPSSLASALGLSLATLREILLGGPESGKDSWERLRSLILQANQGPFCPQVYCLKATSQSTDITAGGNKEERTVLGEGWVVTPFPFQSLRGFSSHTFPTMSDACEHIYRQLRDQYRLATLRRAYVASVRQALKKKGRLLQNLRDDLSRYQDYEIYKKYADLLYAREEKTPPGVSTLPTRDLFDSNLQEIEIPLDPKLSLIENANRFSLLFQKANRALPRVWKKVGELETELAQMSGYLDQLSAARTIERLGAVAEEIQEEVPPHQENLGWSGACRLSEKGRAASDMRTLQRKVARRFVSSEGMEILVGKSNRDNDILTQRIAKADDFWFHVAGYSGSHVVLKNPRKLEVPPQQSLLEAAQLAAYFSQARNAPKVEVRYSRKKYVSKPRGSKPGMMQLKDYKSVMVRPGLL